MCDSIIYLIVNRVNGWFYVGRSVDPRGRWTNHKSDLRRGQHSSPNLQRDWDLYGEDQFLFLPIRQCPRRVAPFIETILIRLSNAVNYYNVAENGYGGANISLEVRQKISESMRGRKLSCSHREAISNGMCGRKLSQKHRNNLSLSRVGEKSHRSKLTVSNVQDIRKRVANGEKQIDLAREFCVTKMTLADVIHRRTWRHVTDG